jgi:hypothetical protein
MRFARTVPVNDLPEMQAFECRLCRLAVTAEQVLGIMEMVSLQDLKQQSKSPDRRPRGSGEPGGAEFGFQKFQKLHSV